MNEKTAEELCIEIEECLKQDGRINNEEILTNLKERLDVEELITDKIKSYFDDLKRQSNNNQRSDDSISSVRSISKSIRPLNVKLLKELNEKNKNASELIKDKDIILLLGGTGVGKSLTIHYLCGSKFREETRNGLNHITPIDVKSDALENVKTSPFAQSETQYLYPVEITVKKPSGDVKIQLCDTPGKIYYSFIRFFLFAIFILK